jgi:hypothetical protein
VKIGKRFLTSQTLIFMVKTRNSVGPAGRGMFHIPHYCVLLTLDCISTYHLFYQMQL